MSRVVSDMKKHRPCLRVFILRRYNRTYPPDGNVYSRITRAMLFYLDLKNVDF